MKRLVVVLAVIGLLTIGVWGEGMLKVYFLNVGHGDAILVDYGKKEMLIDGGESDSIVERLRGLVEGSLDVLVATHPDEDHIGGLDKVIEAFSVDALFTNGDQSANTECYELFRNAAQDEELDEVPALLEDTIWLGDLAFRVLNPQSASGSRNESSVVLMLEYEDIRFLFTGDIEANGEAALQQTASPANKTLILKVAHHGSDTSTSPEFLRWADPELAIVSGDEDDLTPAVIENLGIWGVPFLTTDENGTICVSTDGRSIRITTCEEVP